VAYFGGPALPATAVMSGRTCAAESMATAGIAETLSVMPATLPVIVAGSGQAVDGARR
jgi:hypothetical protein